MGLLRYVSASQVENWRKCQRYWWHKSILKTPEPPKPSADKGKAVHKVAEVYLKTGEFVGEPEHVTIFKSALPIFPSRGEGLLLEHKFELPTYPGGPIWVGYIDIADPRTKPKRILDAKTRSDPRYFKTPEELLSDTQMMSYCKAGLDGPWPEDNEAEVAHLYMLTKKPYRAHRVPKASSPPAIATREHVNAIWERDLVTVREMDDLLTKLGSDALADIVEPTTASCSAYGGCGFRSQCGLGPTNSQLIQLGKTSAERRAALFQGPTHGGTKMADEPKLSLKDRLAAKRAAAGAAVDAAAGVGTRPIVQNAPPEAPPAAAAADPGAIVPPDAPDRNEKPPVTPQEAAGTVETPPAAPKTKKAKEKPTAATNGTAGAGAAVLPANGAVTVAARKSFSIYIDSFPVKGVNTDTIVLYEDWIGPFAQAVAEDNGLKHYGLAEFGKGPKMLAALVAQNIDELPEVLVISTFASAAHEVLEVLIPHATYVSKRI